MTLAIAALMAIIGFQAPKTGTGVLEGVVTRSDSSRPVEGARVAIWGDQGPDFETRTDGNGHYAFGDLPAGIFNMEIAAEGYLTVPDPSTSMQIRITIGDRQRLRHDFSITSAGAINGRILDKNGEPVSGISVEVLKLKHDLRDRPIWEGVANSATNEKGEYRITDLPTGEYYVKAARKPARGISAGTLSADMAATYFPGTADARSAATIHVREGDDVKAEFSLADARTYGITGKVTQPDSRKLDSPIILYAIPQDSKIPLDSLMSAGVTVKPAAEGEWDFQFRGLLPGAYDLVAVALPTTRYDSLQVGDTLFFGPLENVPGRAATTTLQIRDEDQEDVRLSLDPGVDVKGRVRVMDNAGSPFPFDIQRKLFQFRSAQVQPDTTPPQIILRLNHKQDFVASLLSLVPIEQIMREPDAFTFEGVPEGTYEVEVGAPGAGGNFYVEDIRSGARSVFDDGLTVSKDPIDLLEVVLGIDGGTIGGSIAGAKKLPALVVLAPIATRRRNGALFKTMMLEDASQPFRFAAVAPGSYSLFAFEVSESSETVPYRSSEFLSLHETRSVRVTVEKGVVAAPIRVPLIQR